MKRTYCCKVGGLCAVFALTVIVWTRPMTEICRVIQSSHPIVHDDQQYHTQGLHHMGHDSQQCHPHQHVYFLKVHKAASTTTFGIFARFALVRNLNVMTLVGTQGSYPYKNFDKFLPPSPKWLTNGKYDIYCEHSVYVEEYLLTKLHNDTINIAIVREPMSQLRSTFLFYKLADKMNLTAYDDPVAEFLQRPLVHARRFPEVVEYTQNRVSREFGYEGKGGTVEDYLKYLDSRFLVLVLERYAESLVVMRRKLCWGMKDILYSQARKQIYETPQANGTLISLYQAWSPLAYVFYDYFSERMEELISKQDDDFQEEVQLFERYLEETNEFCDSVCARMGSLLAAGDDEESLFSLTNETRYFEESKWDPGFNVTGLDCLAMRYDHQVYREAQNVRLFPEYCTHARNRVNSFQFNFRYCDRSLSYGLPRFIIKKPPRFYSSCF